MVTVLEQVIIAQPNCSASWKQNQWLLFSFGLWAVFISLLFCLRGAWLMLPYICVAFLLFALILFSTYQKLQQRHILRFQSKRLTLEKTNQQPSLCRQLVRKRTRISVERQAHPASPLKISLCTAQETIPLGNFLNRQDSLALLTELRHRGLVICNDSQAGSLLG